MGFSSTVGFVELATAPGECLPAAPVLEFVVRSSVVCLAWVLSGSELPGLGAAELASIPVPWAPARGR